MADLTPEERAHQIVQMSLRWLSMEEDLEKPWPAWEQKIAAQIRAAEQAARDEQRKTMVSRFDYMLETPGQAENVAHNPNVEREEAQCFLKVAQVAQEKALRDLITEARAYAQMRRLTDPQATVEGAAYEFLMMKARLLEEKNG